MIFCFTKTTSQLWSLNVKKEEKRTRCYCNFNVDPLQFSLRPNKYYREFLWKENVLIHFTPEPEIATVRIDTLFKKREVASPSCQFQMGDLKVQEPYYNTKKFIFSFTWAGLAALFSSDKTTYLQKYINWVCPKKGGSFHWLGEVLNLFKVPGHTWDSVGSPRGR